MKKTGHILITVFRSIFNIRYIIILVLLPIVSCMYIIASYTTKQCPYAGGDVLAELMSPILLENPSFSRTAIVILPLLSSLLIFGVYMTSEFQYRCRFTIPRTGNIYRWYGILSMGVVLFAVLYSIVYFLAAELFIKGFNLSNGFAHWDYTGLNQMIAGQYTAFNVRLIADFSIRLILVLTIQVLFLLYGNKTLSFAAAFVLIGFSAYLKEALDFMPLVGTYTVRNLYTAAKDSTVYGTSLLYYALLQAICLYAVKRRNFLIREIYVR